MKKLTNQDLLVLLGGKAVTSEEYCATLDMIINNNWGNMSQDEKDSAMQAWNKYCSEH